MKIETILTKYSYPEQWQSDNLKAAMREISIDFRDWCLDKQQPYVRNGWQDLSTEELFNEFLNDNQTNLF